MLFTFLDWQTAVVDYLIPCVIVHKVRTKFMLEPQYVILKILQRYRAKCARRSRTVRLEHRISSDVMMFVVSGLASWWHNVSPASSKSLNRINAQRFAEPIFTKKYTPSFILIARTWREKINDKV
jgi:hypothetical protein